MPEPTRPPGHDERCALIRWSTLPVTPAPYAAGQRVEITALVHWGLFHPGAAPETGVKGIPGHWTPDEPLNAGTYISAASLHLERRAPFPGASQAVWTTAQIGALLGDRRLMADLAAEQIEQQRGSPIRFAGLHFDVPELSAQDDHFKVTFPLRAVPAGPFNLALWLVSWAGLLGLGWLVLGRAFMNALNAGLHPVMIFMAVVAIICVPPLLAYYVHDRLLGIKWQLHPLWTPGQHAALDVRTPEAFEMQLGRERITRLQALQHDARTHPERQMQPERLRALEARLQQGIETQERQLGELERAQEVRRLENLERLSDAELLLQGIAPESHKRRRTPATLGTRPSDQDPG